MHEPGRESTEALGTLRASLQRFPIPAAFKHVLRQRGVPVRGDARPPLRDLTGPELAELRAATREGSAHDG